MFAAVVLLLSQSVALEQPWPSPITIDVRYRVFYDRI